VGEEDPVRSDPDLWPAVRWPLLVLAVAVAGIAAAAVLDRTAAHEWALTAGALANHPDRVMCVHGTAADDGTVAVLA
jgi:hypothetical protein